MTSSPADRFAAAREAASHPETARFAARQKFELDPFQIAGCQALEDGHGVLVAAPTGAGKTIVGEFAIHLAMLSDHEKAFYTTPMKALSNQKFRELTEVYGADNVGLLTGDTNINGSARIVVMTTEVLRNMLYADSAALRDLRYVIMDEVHYLADRFRGAVWEEVIIHLPRRVRVVALSATVSKAEEFGDYLREDRELHAGILAVTGNAQLVDLVVSLRLRTRLYGIRPLSASGRLIAQAEEHHRLLQLLRDGDGDAAEQLLYKHISHAREFWATDGRETGEG